MSLDYDNTPTAESKALTAQSLSDNREITMPWGRLFATMKNLQSLDLVNKSYVFGRMIDCDVVIPREAIPDDKKYINISKKHFKITKEAADMPTVIEDLSKNGTFVNGKLVGKNKRIILQNGDRISAGFVCLKVYMYTSLESLAGDDFLSPELKKKYAAGRILGRGACGEVRLVYEIDTCLRFAVKKIKKSATLTKSKHLNDRKRIETEIKILQSLSHDCIVKVENVVETDESYFIVLEYLDGGELTDRILSMEPLPESTIKFLFYQIVLAVQYLHSQGITHRDLKPQNVLLVSTAAKTRVKVTDFGLSKILTDETCLRTMCGTPFYLAPEVWRVNANQVYDNKVDVWSLGVILFYMFAKELPFRAENTEELAQLILSGSYTFNGKVWGRISKQAKDLINKMLTIDPEERVSIDQVLSHEWINKDLLLQYEIARLLDYIPESSCSSLVSSSTNFNDCEPPTKRLLLSNNNETTSRVNSWP